MTPNSSTAPNAGALFRYVVALWGAWFELNGWTAPAPEASAGPVQLPAWEVVEPALAPTTAPIRATALLPAEAWSGRTVGTLADAFRPIPGAVMLESFGGFEPPRLSIRGSGVQSAPSSRGVALLLDQLPLGLADGSFNSALLDPLVATRVEVQRGLDGWRTAPATMGGALDLRTTADMAPGIRLEAGSFGTLRVRAKAPGIALSHTRQEGFRPHAGQARTAALATLARPLGAGVAARFNVYHAHARYDVPGPLTLAAALAAPRTVSADVWRDRPSRTAEVTRVAGGAGASSRERQWDVGFSLARSTDDFRQLQANGTSESRSDDANFHAGFSQPVSLGEIEHALRVDASVSRGWRELKRFRNDAATRGPLFGRDDLSPTTVSWQVEDTVALNRDVAGTVGVAHVLARRRVVDRLGRVAGLRMAQDALLPQASLRWRLAPRTMLFASVSRSAEPPTFDDLLPVAGAYPTLVRRTQPLRLQRATTYEAGFRGVLPRFTWDLAVYQAAWRDEILRLADASGAARGAVNASPTTHEGVEASARWRIVDQGLRVTLTASTTWNRFRFEADPIYGRGRLAGLPPQLGNAELLAQFPGGAFAAVGADWTQGCTLVDHAGRLAYGGRTLAHARTGFHIRQQWTLWVEVKNLLDRRAIASTAGVLDLARNRAATSIFLPAPGRAFSVGVEWRR